MYENLSKEELILEVQKINSELEKRNHLVEELKKQLSNLSNRENELKAKIKALIEDNNRLKVLSDASFESIFLSEKGICLEQNSTAERMFGYTHDEAIGRCGTDWIVPEDREIVRKNMMSLISEPYEVTALRKDGSTFPAEIQAQTINYSGRSVRVIALRDVTDRRESEKELQDSYDRLKRVMNSIDALIYIADMKTYEVLFINEYMRKIWGNIEGQLCWKAIQKDQIGPCDFCTNDKLLTSDGQPAGIYHWEFQNTNNKRWYDCRDLAIRWIDNNLVRMEIATDITDRKKMDKALQESLDFKEKILSESPVGISIYQAETGQCLATNKSMAKFVGANEEEVLSQNFYKIDSWKKTRLFETAMSVLKDNSPKQIEINVTTTFGKSISADCYFAAFFSGNQKYLLLIVNETTERRLAEKELSYQKNIESELTSLTAELLVTSDIVVASYHILKTAKKLTNCPHGFVGSIDQDSGNLISHSMTQDIWHECNVPDKSIIFNKSDSLWGWVIENKKPLLTNNPDNDPRSIGTPEGHIPITSFLSVPSIINGRLVGQIALANAKNGFKENDLITIKRISTIHSMAILRHLYEQDIVIEKNKAEIANQAKSTFLANMSHEIRTPLNAILGMTEMSLHHELSEEVRENLYVVRDSANHLMDVINDVLDISKIEAGKIEIDCVDFDIVELIQSILNTFTVHLKKQSLYLKFEKDETTPRYVKGDPIKLKQILVNLLGNAIKFTKQGGITVEIAGKKELNAIHYTLSVADTGIGISQDKLNSIFESFSQADSSTTRKYGGTGLGLNISKKLIELMGGTISVESTPDKGSIFYLVFKLDMGNKSFITEKQEPIKSSCQEKQTIKKNILVVDDISTNLKVAEKFLNMFGHSPYIVTSVKEAFQLLSTTSFDLIFMDIEMPEMDGLEATRIIRSGKLGSEVAKIPIVAMTAHALTSFENKCIKAGMNDFITKPINVKVLKEKLKRILEISKRP